MSQGCRRMTGANPTGDGSCMRVRVACQIDVVIVSIFGS